MGGTWLLLGDLGFIGGHVRAAAERAGAHVVGASRSGRSEFGCDLGDRASVDSTVGVVRPSRIINAAGPPSVARSWEEPAETVQLHAVAAVHLLEAARRHVPEAHLTFLSSAEVYGSSDEDMDETMPVGPLTPYGAAKAAMEVLCEQHARAHGTSIAILRLFNQIGPGLTPGHAIADFARSIADAERSGAASAKVVLGNPDSVRDYTDVRDSAEAIATVAGRRISGTFNLCSGRATKTRELIDTLAAATSLPVDIEVDPELARPADPARKVGRPDRLAAAIGWSATTTLPQTISDILDSARLFAD